MRFLHTADWQLGMTRHFLNGEAQPRYSAARRDAWPALGALADEVGRGVRRGRRRRLRAQPARPATSSASRWRRCAAIGVPVYLLPGNHDPLDASSVYTSALFTAERPDNVDGAGSAGCATRCAPGLQIVAAPWRSKAPTTDLVAEVLDGLPADGDDPHRRRPRRRRHLRSRQGQARR